jgi:hypothetical protein
VQLFAAIHLHDNSLILYAARRARQRSAARSSSWLVLVRSALMTRVDSERLQASGSNGPSEPSETPSTRAEQCWQINNRGSLSATWPKD